MDIKMTVDGELEVDSAGDIALVTADEELVQKIIFSLKTQKGDWILSPKEGCSLEDFIGQPNTEQTHALIEDRIRLELERILGIIRVEVDAVALSQNEVYILVEIDSVQDPRSVLQVTASLDLREGKVFARAESRGATTI